MPEGFSRGERLSAARTKGGEGEIKQIAHFKCARDSRVVLVQTPHKRILRRQRIERAAILNLSDRVKAREIELLALLCGELRSQDQGPVVELLADDLRAEFVGGGLQRGDVVDGEEGVVGLAEADLRALQLLLDEAVPVEVVGGLERKERGDPHHHRAQGFVAEVEVVVREGQLCT